MKLIAALAIIVALLVAGCGGGGGSQSTAVQSTVTTTPLSISQLEHKAAVQREMAQHYLQQTMQITREAGTKGEEYLSKEEHQRAASLIRLNRQAQQRAAAFHKQMCELVLEDPRTPHSDRLGMIANSCE